MEVSSAVEVSCDLSSLLQCEVFSRNSGPYFLIRITIDQGSLPPFVTYVHAPVGSSVVHGLDAQMHPFFEDWTEF